MRKHAISRFICQQAAASDRRCLITAQVAGRPAHMTSEVIARCNLVSHVLFRISQMPQQRMILTGFALQAIRSILSVIAAQVEGLVLSCRSKCKPIDAKVDIKPKYRVKKYKKHKMPKHHITRVPLSIQSKDTCRQIESLPQSTTQVHRRVPHGTHDRGPEKTPLTLGFFGPNLLYSPSLALPPGEIELFPGLLPKFLRR
jgi:hypothetical protein